MVTLHTNINLHFFQKSQEEYERLAIDLNEFLKSKEYNVIGRMGTYQTHQQIHQVQTDKGCYTIDEISKIFGASLENIFKWFREGKFSDPYYHLTDQTLYTTIAGSQ